MKKIYCGVLLALLTLSLIGCSSAPKLSSSTQQKIQEKTQNNNQSQTIENLQNNNTQPTPQDSKEKKGFTFYNILGKSNKLTKKEEINMMKWRQDIVNMAKNNSDRIYINGDTQEKVVALTFDDGPDSKITPQILDILKANNIHASFFFIGERAKVLPSVVKRVYSEGNLVLNHSFSHPDLSKKNLAEIKTQINSTQNIINDIIGKKPAIIRPPYGAVNDAVLKEVNAQDLKIAIWSIDTLDWSQKEKSNIVKNVVDNVRPGEIILMHSNDDKAATAEALPELITKLKEKGYRFVDLGELLNISPYK